MADQPTTENGPEHDAAPRWDARRLLALPRPVVIGIALVVAVVIGLVVRGTSSDSSEAPTTTARKPVYRNTTADLTVAAQLPLDPQYAPFLRLLTASGWLDRLDGTSSSYTLFVPDDTAFAHLSAGESAELFGNNDAAKALVERHLVDHPVAFVQLLSGEVTSVTTVGGTVLDVKVDGSTVTIGGVVITKHDITAKNGVIHVLDAVIAAKPG